MRLTCIAIAALAFFIAHDVNAQVSIQEAQRRLAERQAQKEKAGDDVDSLRKEIERLQEEVAKLKQENTELRALLAAVNPPTNQVRSFQNDPGESYKVFCTKFIALLNVHVERNKESRGNEEPQVYVQRWHASDAKIDVQKTNSVITPFIGTLTMTAGWTTTASRSGKDVDSSYSLWRITFASQDGQWTPKSIERFDEVHKNWESAKFMVGDRIFREVLRAMQNP